MNVNLMDVLRVARDWVTAEAGKDWTTISATIKRAPFNGYVGWVGYGNLGDEAVFQSAQKLFPHYDFKPYRIAKPGLLVSRASTFPIPLSSVMLGGGTLINQSTGWLEECRYAVSKGIPTFCLGTGVAAQNSLDKPPADQNNLLAEWVEVLKKFVYVGVRGPLSAQILNNAGLDVEVVGDSALVLAQESYKKKVFRKSIGINVSYGTDGIMHGNQATFIDTMREVVEQLLAEGFDVTILPIWKDDLAASLALCENLHSPHLKLVRAFGSVSQYLEALASCDIFIGQKLHATIFSTMLRIPSIMLEYRPKCLDYMQSIGMEKYSIRTDLLTSKLLMSKIKTLTGEYQIVCKQLDEKIRFYKSVQLKKAREIKQQLYKIT